MRKSAFVVALIPVMFLAVGVAAADDPDSAKPVCEQTTEESCGGNCPQKKDASDKPFHASIYLGEAVDTFAGAETIDYLNPDDSGSSTWRAVGGFDFEYRLAASGRNRLWIYGETVHGVRSKDVDCSKDSNKNLSVCKDAIDPSNPEKSLVYILRNASSLEAFTGLRWEFHRLNPGSAQPAWLYLKAQAGFISVAGGGSDVADVHHVTLGAQAEEGGPFGGSFIEVGYGRNDLFLDHSTGRWVIDGLLSFPFAGTWSSTFFGIKDVRGFAEITADTDMGKGSDSIQTYFGLDFILGKSDRNDTAKNKAAEPPAKPDTSTGGRGI